MTGSDKDTVIRVLVAGGRYSARRIRTSSRGISPAPAWKPTRFVWSYCGAKEANKTKAGQGDLWTYTAICARHTKLIFSWVVGSRSSISTHAFMHDMASRLSEPDSAFNGRPCVQGSRRERVRQRCDFAQLQKNATPDGISGRFAQQTICIGAEKEIVMGKSRSRSRFYVLCRTFQPHDPLKQSPLHAQYERLLEEGRQPCPRGQSRVTRAAPRDATKNAKGHQDDPAMAVKPHESRVERRGHSGSHGKRFSDWCRNRLHLRGDYYSTKMNPPDPQNGSGTGRK